MANSAMQLSNMVLVASTSSGANMQIDDYVLACKALIIVVYWGGYCASIIDPIDDQGLLSFGNNAFACYVRREGDGKTISPETFFYNGNTIQNSEVQVKVYALY